jgi:pre-mRNA-processing factor 17
MLVNIPYNDMSLPLAGPQNPLNPNTQVHYNQNTLAGHVEELMMDDTSFKSQHLTHEVLGYAANPSEHANGEFIGDIAKALANDGRTVDLVKSTKGERKDLKRKRKDRGDLAIVEGESAYKGPWAKWQGDDEPAPVPEGYVSEPSPSPEAEAEAAAARKKKARAGLGTESTIFHGKNERDYQGRTYMYPPYGVAPQLHQEAGSQECFIPKVCVHTWTGHTGGIAAIRLFPGTSHLLLSASMDTKIKVRAILNLSSFFFWIWILCVRVVGC